jgi:hypothetical protein
MQYKLISTCPYADVIRHDDGHLEVVVYVTTEPVKVTPRGSTAEVESITFEPKEELD